MADQPVPQTQPEMDLTVAALALLGVVGFGLWLKSLVYIRKK